MAILENIDIDIDIDKGILQNIDIDKILYQLGFGISNTPIQSSTQSLRIFQAFANSLGISVSSENYDLLAPFGGAGINHLGCPSAHAPRFQFNEINCDVTKC